MTFMSRTLLRDPPAPHPDTETAIFDDSGLSAVVLDMRTRRVHRFNAEAAAVWALCDGRTSAAEIGDELHALFGAPADRIADDVSTALSAFASLGLLVDGTDLSVEDSAATHVLPRPPDP